MGFEGLSNTRVEQVALAVDVQGQQALADLGIALASVNTDLRTLQQAYQQGVLDINEFEKATNRLIAEQRDLKAQVDAATYAMKNGTDALRSVAGDGAESVGKLTNSAFTLAYALDDVQYGLIGLSNQIPGLVAIFSPAGPIGAGVAAGASALALYAQHWEKLADLMMVGATNTDHASVALRANAEAAVLARKETEQLTEAKQRQQVVDTLLSLKSTEEKKRVDLVTKAIAEAGGGDDVRTQLVQSFLAEGTGARDQAREDYIARALASGQWTEDDPYIQGKIREMNELNDAENMRRAEQMLREATESEQGLTALQNRVLRNPNIFRNNLAMDLGEATIQGQFDRAVREQRAVERQEELKRQQREEDAEKRRQEREAEQTAKAREQAQRQLEQTEEGRLLNLAGPAVGIGLANTTFAKAVGREQKEAARESARDDKAAQRQVDAEASEFIPDFGPELGGAIAGRLARGQSMERAQRELIPTIVRRLQNSASFDQTLDASAVAAKIAADVANDVGAKIAAQQNVHGPQGAASAVAREMQQDAARKAQREGDADRRDAERQFAAQQAQLFATNFGGTPQLAQAFGEKALANFKRLGDVALAQQAAYGELLGQLQSVSQRIGQIEANQARLMGQARTVRGNFLRNRFPR
jgi:hypothetical protein